MFLLDTAAQRTAVVLGRFAGGLYPASGTMSRYGKLGNLDRVFLAHGRTLSGVPVGSGQGFQWSAGSGTSLLFANGDNNTKYHVTFAAVHRGHRKSTVKTTV